MKKPCSCSFCIICSVIILLVINVCMYYLVDSGLKTLNLDQIEKGRHAKQKYVLSENEILPQASKPEKTGNKQRFLPINLNIGLTASDNAGSKLAKSVKNLSQKYKNTSNIYMQILHSVLRELRFNDNNNVKLSLADQLMTGRSVIPQPTYILGNLLNTLCSSKILQADNSKKGTQLKLLLTLEGHQKALFKPQWYNRNAVIPGPVYAGKDRHNAEVAAFHLSLLLGLRRVPLTVGRRIDLRREVMPTATTALRETFFQEGNNTCFYGVCFYCSPTDPVCAKRDIIEGSLILWLPHKLAFVRHIHPWQRSYRQNYIARWETEDDFCVAIKKSKLYSANSSERLLDLIETAIFDFLIGNGDRHHYEVTKNTHSSTIILFDNGKSFGNPEKDYIDILAPLYQCCMLRKSTWQNLFNFRGGVLGESLKKTLENSHIAPVLAPRHYDALDRRLDIVFAAVEICLQDNRNTTVFVEGTN